jgi:hypothetical protein
MARQGRPPTRNCPLWLSVSPDGARYDIKPERVNVVRRIFAMAAAGMGETAITKMLNSEGVLNFHGKMWKTGQVDHIVTSKAPIGLVVSAKGGDEGTKEFQHYPQIVDETTWRAAQQARKANRATKQNWSEAVRNGSLPTVRNLLPGLLYCAHCSGKMAFNASAARKNAPQRFRLYCIAAMNKSGCKANRSLSYLPLERAILSRLEYADRNGLLNTNPTEEVRIAGLRIDQIKNSIDTATIAYNNLADAYERNPSPLKEGRMNKKEAEINAMRAELREAENNRPAFTTDDHKKALANLREAAERGDYESRVRVRLALNALVDRIEIDVISERSAISVARKAYSFIADAEGETYDFSSVIERFGEKKVDPVFVISGLPCDVTPWQAAFLSRLVTMFAAVKPPDEENED